MIDTLGVEGNKVPAWLLSLDGRWFSCTVTYRKGGPLWIFNAAEDIVGGMSGSPIITDDGLAIGVVCLGGGTGIEGCREGGPNPRLMSNLPGWLVGSLGELR